jgi:hypothetical protein
VTLDDLRRASDHDLKVIPNLAQRGLVQICGLIGRKPPCNVRTPERIEADYEQGWRSKIGDHSFDSILDLIVVMAGDVLDRPSAAAGRALWKAARRRRALQRYDAPEAP